MGRSPMSVGLTCRSVCILPCFSLTLRPEYETFSSLDSLVNFIYLSIFPWEFVQVKKLLLIYLTHQIVYLSVPVKTSWPPYWWKYKHMWGLQLPQRFGVWFGYTREKLNHLLVIFWIFLLLLILNWWQSIWHKVRKSSKFGQD